MLDKRITENLDFLFDMKLKYAMDRETLDRLTSSIINLHELEKDLRTYNTEIGKLHDLITVLKEENNMLKGKY